MFTNAFRMAKSVSKLLFRSKAFFVVGIVIPLMATLLINIWSGLEKVEKTDEVTKLESIDTSISYQVDFNRFPIKVYDLVEDEGSRLVCENLNDTGIFQVFVASVTDVADDELEASILNSAKKDKIGAIIVLDENKENVKLYKVGDDERFDLLKETLPIIIASPIESDVESKITFTTTNNGSEIDYYATRDFSYCLAIACIAFIFGGVLILGTVISEKQDHVYARIMMTNATKGSYLLSKLMLVLGFSLLQTTIMSLAFVLFVKVDIGVNILQFFIILLLEGLIFNLISLCAGLFCNSMAAASFLAFAMWSISALLAGTYFDISGASELYKKIALIMPERWALLAVSKFSVGDNGGYTIMFCATAAFLVIIFVVGVMGLHFGDEE